MKVAYVPAEKVEGRPRLYDPDLNYKRHVRASTRLTNHW